MKQRMAGGQIRELTTEELAARQALGQAETAIAQGAAARTRLVELDLQSVRGIRELLIEKHPEDPIAVELAAIESQAVDERAKLPKGR